MMGHFLDSIIARFTLQSPSSSAVRFPLLPRLFFIISPFRAGKRKAKTHIAFTVVLSSTLAVRCPPAEALTARSPSLYSLPQRVSRRVSLL